MQISQVTSVHLKLTMVALRLTPASHSWLRTPELTVVALRLFPASALQPLANKGCAGAQLKGANFDGANLHGATLDLTEWLKSGELQV